MDAAILSAVSALAGSGIGAFASFGTTWLVQTNQMRYQQRAAEVTKREALYAAFIGEAAKRMTDALSHQAETPEVLVLLVASIGQMRLFSSKEVIAAAEQIARLIIDTYMAPNRSMQELHDTVMDDNRLDPLAHFGEACRAELRAMMG